MEVVRSIKIAAVKMLKSLKTVICRRYENYEKIVMWTKMSTMCTQIINFVDILTKNNQEELTKILALFI